MRVRVLVVAAIALAAGGLRPGLATQPSGEAITVVPSVAADGAAGSRVLEVKGPVFMGDLIKTDKAGQTQLKFLDDTRMVIGPNSQLTIDSFVFANSTTAKKFSIDAVRGAFRFITGASRKLAYSIKTPTAMIGVRGTLFDLSVGVDGTTNLALYKGSLRLCDNGQPTRRCAVLAGRCSVIVLAPGKDFRWVNSVSERTAMMDSLFPYAFNQSSLLPDFRVDSASCNVRDLYAPTGSSISPASQIEHQPQARPKGLR
jgi:ferric-dicitrate binding protein FerR (iron transport regulator)